VLLLCYAFVKWFQDIAQDNFYELKKTYLKVYDGLNMQHANGYF